MDVNTIVTDRIIAQLKQGTIPWEKPWIGEDYAFNRATGKQYSLFNQILLDSPGEYGSFKQWQFLGGKIKKGAKSQIVVFWKPAEKKVSAEEQEDEEEKNTPPVLRYYRVFHISQVEGVEPLDKDKYPDKFVPNESADDIIRDYLSREHVNFQEVKDGGQSCYSVLTDTVTVPEKRQFIDTNLYYGTVFHELTHSTGHPKRLNRISKEHSAPFGSMGYAREELVAEIGSATVLNMLSMETKRTQDNNASYVQSWIKALENDTKCIVSASGRAEKAVRMIMGTNDAELSVV